MTAYIVVRLDVEDVGRAATYLEFFAPRWADPARVPRLNGHPRSVIRQPAAPTRSADPVD